LSEAPPNLPAPFPFGTFPTRERKRKIVFGEAFEAVQKKSELQKKKTN
jgi:hypothetical protein